MIISHNFISVLQKNCHKQILKQEILSEEMSHKNLKLKTFRINCLIAMFINKNLTNMPLKFILPSNILIFKMIIPTNVIFMTTVLKTISKCSWYTDVIFELIVWTKRSNYKCVPTPVTFTKLTNITNMENYLHILVIW